MRVYLKTNLKMNRRNLKAIKVVKALEKMGCILVRQTDHGVIVENPKNKKSTNVPTHRDILAVWIYNNIIRQLEIDKEELEQYL
ncbi:hypothetical protein COU57_05330 [Candidatus Pacearchaeota archaeon CG10_big_fil_rev_8_21_14_0_10_32_14]|nr:MAG: hypothetical protein COU57_05330 [Candidatus Pacearchaeota archaeon CG10_big_fil_rev_8_21_14_0_10_32_14]